MGHLTLTTVGYGDIVPHTRDGRLAGVFLMITGLGTLGILSGTMASFFRTSGPADEPPTKQQPDGAAGDENVEELWRQPIALADRRGRSE